MSGIERWAPLFPLGLVLLPREQLPLHIFEPRYRAMTERCEQEEIPFCVLLARQEGLVQIGCEAWIEETLRSYPDGRRDIMTMGGERLRVIELREHRAGYHEGRVEPLEDLEDQGDPEASAVLLSIHRECQRLQRAMIRSLGEPAGGSGEAEEIELEPGYTFALASRTQLSPGDRQALLELRRESEREQLLLAYLAQLRPRLEQALHDLPHVRGNGKAKTQD